MVYTRHLYICFVCMEDHTAIRANPGQMPKDGIGRGSTLFTFHQILYHGTTQKHVVAFDQVRRLSYSTCKCRTGGSLLWLIRVFLLSILF